MMFQSIKEQFLCFIHTKCSRVKEMLVKFYLVACNWTNSKNNLNFYLVLPVVDLCFQNNPCSENGQCQTPPIAIEAECDCNPGFAGNICQCEYFWVCFYLEHLGDKVNCYKKTIFSFQLKIMKFVLFKLITIVLCVDQIITPKLKSNILFYAKSHENYSKRPDCPEEFLSETFQQNGIV